MKKIISSVTAFVAVALPLGLFVIPGNVRAQDLTWTNTDASGVWQDPYAWETNSTGGTGGFPNNGASAWFTNAGTYYVTLTDNVSIASNYFSNASGTVATVTLDLGTSQLSITPSANGNHWGFVVGSTSTSTTTVYLASNNNGGYALSGANSWTALGLNGVGTLFLTNGTGYSNVSMGHGGGGRGILVISGTNTSWTYSHGGLIIGNNSNSFGNSVVVSNGAVLGSDGYGSLRLGSGPYGDGSSNNTILLDSGATMFLSGQQNATRVNVIGNGSTGTFGGSYNNTATVQGGAVLDCGGTNFWIGSAFGNPATNNMLTVGAGSSVTDIQVLSITASNTLNLQGGLLQASSVVSNFGTIKGFGSLIVTNGSGTGSVVVNGGSLILGVGTFQTDNLVVTNGGVVQHAQSYQVNNATVTIAGGSEQAGSNLVAGSSANSTGIVTVTEGGQLVVTNGVVGIGNNGTVTGGIGVGSMIVSNGTVLANQILLGGSAGGQGQLAVQTNGLVNLVGTNAVLVVDGPSGVVVDGGALNILSGFFEIGVGGSGTMSMSGGSADCMVVFVGYESQSENGQGTLTISGGQMIISSTLDLGFSSGDTGWIWMSGGTLTATANTTIIGDSGVGQLTLSNGSTVVASALSVGTSGVAGSGGTLTVAGGALTVSSGLIVGTGTAWVNGGQLLAPSSSIVIGSNGIGQMTISSGLVQANSLVLTNGANSQFAFPGGALSSGGTVVTNSQNFLVGNGSSAATFNLMGGVHWFGNGLEIASNATLSGCGTINGDVLVDAGGTVLANCGGTLTFMGSLINNGIMHAENGSVLESYDPVVNNGIIDIMDGTTNFQDTFFNNGTVVNASYFKVISMAKQTSDINLIWTTVGGRSYVVQTNAPQPNGSYINNFTDLSAAVAIPGTTLGSTNFLDIGGATNTPARYYRVRLVP
jgi:hypothetical protein